MERTFKELGIREEIVLGLEKIGIKVPTGIQDKSIPLALENKDIIGQSQTGSGKTLAYLLPLFEKIDHTKKEMQALVLAPTHELAMQIDSQIKLLSENAGVPVTSAPIIGEANMKRQIEKLREKPHIVTGSAGRIYELIKMKKISAHTIKTIVVDESDKMLDINNTKIVKDIIKTTMKDRQLMMFSASINDRTLGIGRELMKDPQFVTVDEEKTVSPNIEHLYFIAERRDKVELLRKLIASINPEKGIVFINRVDDLEVLTSKLQYHNMNASSIFGSISKEERKSTIESFRNGKLQLLIASDLAARGLDIQGVTHIFNMNLPDNSKEYLHRVGRTGRAGKSGTAISIVTQGELPVIKRYERDLGIEMKEAEIHKGTIFEV